MHKISVIVPVFNVENYLNRCVDSLLKQTVKPFEIILVDDGSTDKSGEICDAYRNDFIRVIHKNNEGLGMTRNVGIEAALGEYIMFIDSDDCYDSDMLEKLISARTEYLADTVISGLRRVDQNGKTIATENMYQNGQYTGDDVKKQLLPRVIGRTYEKKDSLGVSVCATLYSLKIINDNNIRFLSERLYLSEDLLFNIDYLGCAQSVITLSYYGYQYYMNNNTLSTRYRQGRTEKYCALYYLEKSKLENLNIFFICRNRLACQFFNRIRICIKQENVTVSGFSERTAVANIDKICSVELYQTLIRESPIWKLGVKRFIFLWLVKNKKSRILLKISKYL